MGNRKRYAKFQENLFSGNEIKSIFCPPLFRKRPILVLILFCSLGAIFQTSLRGESTERVVKSREHPEFTLPVLANVTNPLS